MGYSIAYDFIAWDYIAALRQATEQPRSPESLRVVAGGVGNKKYGPGRTGFWLDFKLIDQIHQIQDCAAPVASNAAL